MTEEKQETDAPETDPIELGVDDLPTWAALKKLSPAISDDLLRYAIFEKVHQHEVATTAATVKYQEMQYQWLRNHILPDGKGVLKVVE
jgi:hypothetical protein